MKIPEGVVKPVTTEKGFTVCELTEEQITEVFELPEEERNFALFNKRLIAWPFFEECVEVNKLKLYKRSPQFCLKQVQEANTLISKVKEEELENLINGVNGPTPLDD
jgi:hypothetical protein